ncbi:M48 family metallopeptidase [Acinetobacter qingfengensis]|uniref:Peptidase M48 n=1 Tax=Acinetobacter qingfengensis TaxID=1262585 RepID=A0A1E7QWN7_9GAMM|nr:M48 family metallopeptidase [Acinetobacter qingfengensis]KAA8731250.1 M48 family metallopeptidase [Acinetobacter qingfengensis]OEY91503.1 peptidase M48 [Acinetobacter qingfengensis]
MRVLATTTLTAALILSGCSSTTLTSTTGVDRKQLLLVSESEVNALSAQNYNQLVSQAKSKGVLNTNSTQKARLQRIANRLIPQAKTLRPEAASWQWQVNLIKSDELNAFCAPGGKIMFYTGIIDRLKLTDDEIAAIMGHEMAHALREHGRENVSRAYAQQAGLGILAAATGMSEGQAQVANLVGQIGIGLPNNRTQESEADVLGLELMARAGYNPQAAVSLWKKMIAANGAGGSQLLSTHPNPENRIKNIEALLPKVMPLYLQAKR